MMKMMRTLACYVSPLLVLALCLNFVHAQSQAVNNAYRLKVQKGDVLTLDGFHADVVVRTKANADSVTVRVAYKQVARPSGEGEESDMWQFSFRRQGHRLVAKADAQVLRSTMRNMAETKALFQPFKIEIIGPALPLRLNLYSGSISIQGGRSDLDFVMQKGKVLVSSSEGRVKGFLQEGTFSVSQHKGSVELDSYRATSQIESVKGELRLNNFMGANAVSGVEGPVKFTSYKGIGNFKAVKGRFEFDTIRGPLKIEGMDGELRGKSEQGSVVAVLKGQADVRLRTTDGNVNLRAERSGARVNVGTKKGQLLTPSHMKRSQYANIKVVVGRLRGERSGMIHVRSQNGNIQVR